MSQRDNETPAESPEAGWHLMLRARMMQNTSARIEREPNGAVVVNVANVRPRWLVPPLRWMVPFKPEKAIRLDRLGTAIWDLCDGQRTVEDLVDRFSAKQDLTFHEARVSVTVYLRDLIKRGALVVVME